MQVLAYLAGAMLMLASLPLCATPVNPLVINAGSQFSADIQQRFYLFADSADNALIWYVPKVGGIRNVDGFPKLAVRSGLIPEGPFAGESSLNVSGEFSTAGLAGDLQRLSQEAAQRGFRLQAAEATQAETQILLGGFAVDSSGQLEASCTVQTISTGSGNVDIPVCRARNAQGQWQEVDFMGAFQSVLPQGGRSISQLIPFSGNTLPGWEPVFSELLRTGSGWDGQIQLITDWKINTNLTLKDAAVHVHWRTLYPYLIQRMRAMGWRAGAEQINQILSDAIVQQRGIQLSFYQANGSLLSTAQHEQQYRRVSADLVQQLRKKLFTPLKRLRFPVWQLANQPDPINPLQAFIAPTSAELQAKWGAQADRVIQRVPYLRYRREIELRQAELAQSGDMSFFTAASLPEVQRCNQYPLQHNASGARENLQYCDNPCYLQQHSLAYRQCEPDEPPAPPPPPPPPPPPHELAYVLKTNYWWLWQNSSWQYTSYLQDVEQVNVSTFMTVDCVQGTIDSKLTFVNQPGCFIYQ